jgi:hypothetical protein
MGEKFPQFDNVTSTVKKTTHSNKLETLMKKFEPCINEQSIITNAVDTPVRKVAQQQQQQPHVNKQNDQYPVRIMYFLRDLTQVGF